MPDRLGRLTRWVSNVRRRLVQAAAVGDQPVPPGVEPGVLVPPRSPDEPLPAGQIVDPGEAPGTVAVDELAPSGPASGGSASGGPGAGEPVSGGPASGRPAPAAARDLSRDPHPVPRVVRDAAEWSWRLLVIAAAVAVVGWLAWEQRVVIFPLVAALLLAAALQPLVRRLRAAGWTRGPAAAVVFIGFVLVVVGSLTLVGNAVGGQFGDVVEQSQEGLQEIRDWLVGPPFRVDEAQLDRYIDRAVAAFQDDSAVTEQAATAATVAIEILVGLALALFALIFFLYDGERIWAWLIRLFPARARMRAAAAGEVAWRTLAQYIRGIVLVALFDAVAITILLFILRVPLALPLGVLIFFGAFVPLVGAFVTGTIAVLVALVTQGLLTAIVVLIGLVAIQQIESNVFQPLILGRMVRIHPLAVAVAVAIGTLAGGIIGAIIAVPIVALVNAVGTHLTATRTRPPPSPTGGK